MAVPSLATRTGATLSSIPPPKTQTPASLACCTTACDSRPTSSQSSSATSIARLGNEIRYLVIQGLLGCTGSCGGQTRLASGDHRSSRPCPKKAESPVDRPVRSEPDLGAELVRHGPLDLTRASGRAAA